MSRTNKGISSIPSKAPKCVLLQLKYVVKAANDTHSRTNIYNNSAVVARRSSYAKSKYILYNAQQL